MGKITIKEIIETQVSDLDNDNLTQHFDTDIMLEYQGEDYDTMFETLRERIEGQYEFIYYASAMDYLRENDVMLTESLEIASEYGYDPANLNSCILATIHAQRYAMEDVYEVDSDMRKIFDLFNELVREFETDDMEFEIDVNERLFSIYEKFEFEY